MSKKIIVVDDSKTVRDQVRGVLQGAGYAVLEAADGQEGLDEIRRNPDLAMAICDVHMPNVSGIVMLESLQADGVIPELPVIMLTTEAQPTLIQRAKQAGARGWIVKPFKAEHLLAAVKKLARTD
jgi:two-component system, chemotaxis family, chemotaxis protein CheY